MCLPGLTRNSRDFKNLARHLAGRDRVFDTDLRGRGFSSWDANPTNYQPPVDDQDVLKLDFGAIARCGRNHRHVAWRNPRNGTRSDVACEHRRDLLNDIGPQIDAGGVARIGQYVGLQTRPGNWPAALAQARANFGSAYQDLDEAGWLAFTQRGYREDESGVVVADYDPKIGDALRAAPSTIADLWPVWAALMRTPVLVIRGERSDILTAETVERMARKSRTSNVSRSPIAATRHSSMSLAFYLRSTPF